jgi:hypothetical protein
MYKRKTVERKKRAAGWYIIDRANGNRCLHGPYRHEETAAAIRHELELSWDEGDEWNPRPDPRNLWIVIAEVLDSIEEPTDA